MFGAILGGVGLLSGLAAGKKADRAAERAGRMNADFINQETAEAVRRAELGLKQQLGSAQASMAGAGVRGSSGTVQTYLGALETEAANEISWMEESGESRAEIARVTGKQAGDQARMNSYSQFLGGFADLAMSNTGTELMSKWGWI